MALLCALFSLSASYLNCGDQNWTQYSRCSLTSAEQVGMIMPLSLLVMPLWLQPRARFAFVAAVVFCGLMVSLWSTGIPRVLRGGCGGSPNTLILACCPGPSAGLCTCLLNFLLFLLAHSPSLSRSLCNLALSSDVSTSPPSLHHQQTWCRCFQSHHPSHS